MTQQQHLPTQPGLGTRDTSAAVATVQTGHALVLTDAYGVITRVTCAVPWSVFTADNATPERHISLLFGEQDRYFVGDILQRMRNSKTFAVKGAQVRMDSMNQYRAYLDVNHIDGTAPANGLFAWRFSMRNHATADTGSEIERRLARRVEILEQRLEIQRQTAERRSAALNALRSSVQTLARSLKVNRAYSLQQSEQIATLTAERDQLARRIQAERTAANVARQAERGVRNRLDFLTDARWATSDLLDVNTTLHQIADMIVPVFADCCVVDLLDAERSVLTHAVVACNNLHVKSRIEALPESGFIDGGVTHPLRHAMVSGYPSVSHNLDELALDPPPQPEGFLDNAATVGISACIVTPLRARDQVFGTLTLASTEPGYRFLPEHLQFAEDMALPVAQALDNSLHSHDVEQSSMHHRDLLAMVSHELRSPMSVITGYAHLLQRQVARPELDREQITLLSAELQDGVIQLAETASDLLQQDTDQSGIDHQPQQIIDLVDIVTTIVERIEAQRGPDQSGKMLVSAPVTLYGQWSGPAVGRAIEHVLTHALKYSMLDSSIMVTLEKVDGDAVLAVQVTQSGSADIEQERLPTSSAKRTSATLPGFGAGPAMHMAEKVIARYAGRLALEDALEHGACITLTIPIPNADVPPEQ